MKTFIFAKNQKAGGQFKARNFLDSAIVIRSMWPLIDQKSCELYLVGPYYLSNDWPELMRFLETRKIVPESSFGPGIRVINKEWEND